MKKVLNRLLIAAGCLLLWVGMYAAWRNDVARAAVSGGPVGGGSGPGGDAGGTNSRQFGTASLTNLSGGSNVGPLRVFGAFWVTADTFFHESVHYTNQTAGARSFAMQDDGIFIFESSGGLRFGNGINETVFTSTSGIGGISQTDVPGGINLFEFFGDGVRMPFNGGLQRLTFFNADSALAASAITATGNSGDILGAIAVLNSSNVNVRAGASVSNAPVGGTYFSSTGSFTNLNGVPGTLTNLGNVLIAGNVLTNNGDMVRAYWAGVGATAMQNTQNFQIVYGSATILDTGLQISSNILFRASVEITRTGNTALHVEAKFEWLPNLLGATGVPWASTNVNREIVQTNGINTLLALRGSAQRVGAHTNNSFRVYYDPAVR